MKFIFENLKNVNDVQEKMKSIGASEIVSQKWINKRDYEVVYK